MTEGIFHERGTGFTGGFAYLIEEGEAKGRAEGKAEGRAEVVAKMLRELIPVSVIMKCSDFSAELDSEKFAGEKGIEIPL